jgi:hypothetical protein
LIQKSILPAAIVGAFFASTLSPAFSMKNEDEASSGGSATSPVPPATPSRQGEEEKQFEGYTVEYVKVMERIVHTLQSESGLSTIPFNEVSIKNTQTDEGHHLLIAVVPLFNERGIEVLPHHGTSRKAKKFFQDFMRQGENPENLMELLLAKMEFPAHGPIPSSVAGPSDNQDLDEKAAPGGEGNQELPL